MLFPAIFYIIWDSLFTQWGVWSFNDLYITGIKFLHLPIEEIMFFFVVPYCCVFIYECIRCYFPGIVDAKWAGILFRVLTVILLLAGLFFIKRMYTGTTFLFLSATFLIFMTRRTFSKYINLAVFFISYAIILIPFLVVNGFLTAIPVVLYNDTENLGIRIYSIPFEDVFYGMLLIFLNIFIFEWLRNRR